MADNSGKSSRQVEASVSKANGALGRMRMTNFSLPRVKKPTPGVRFVDEEFHVQKRH